MTPFKKDWAKHRGPMSIEAMHFKQNWLNLNVPESREGSVLDDMVWNEMLEVNSQNEN